MYSMVLLMALNTGGADQTAFFGKSCNGCNGYAGACHGSVVVSCSGYNGCSGSRCHGGGFLFGNKCHGSCNGGGFLFGNRCHGSCNGCYGSACYGSACYGSACHGGGVIEKKPETVPPPKPNPSGMAPAPATMIVTLPADAKLTIDDQPTVSTSDRRVFVTPALEAGKEYFYTLKAEVVRDGKVETVSERIVVRAGAEVSATLNLPVATAAK